MELGLNNKIDDQGEYDFKPNWGLRCRFNGPLTVKTDGEERYLVRHDGVEIHAVISKYGTVHVTKTLLAQ